MKKGKLCVALAMAGVFLCAAVAVYAQGNTVRVSIPDDNLVSPDGVPGNLVEIPVYATVQSPPSTQSLRNYLIRVSWDYDFLEFVDLLDGDYTLPADWHRNAYSTECCEVGVIAYQVDPTSMLTLNTTPNRSLFVLQFRVKEDAPDDACTDLIIEEATFNETALPFSITDDGSLCVCNRPKGYVEGYVFAYAPGTHLSPPQGCCPPVGLPDVEMLLYDTYCEPCVGRLVGTAYTDGDGYFLFDDEGEYFMEPPEDPIGTTPGFPKPFRVELPWDGEHNVGLIPDTGMDEGELGEIINVTDLMKLEKFIVGYTALNRFWFQNTDEQDLCSPMITYPQRAAADVNQDGRLNWDDLACMVNLVEYAAGFDPQFPVCYDPYWLAWCEYRSDQFDEWPLCGPDVYQEYDFILALLGDVSATLANGDMFPVKSSNLLRVASQGLVPTGNPVSLPVRLLGASNIDNFQFVIEYDPALVQIDGIDTAGDCAGMEFDSIIQNGRILVTGYSINDTYSGDLTLVRLNGTYLGGTSDVATFAFEGALVNGTEPGSVVPGALGGSVATESSTWGQLKAGYR
jgi:hypothetical protein